MAYGWRRQMLDVDLTNKKIEPRPLSHDLCVKTIGGIGMAAQLAFDYIPPKIDPLGPENALFIVTGPLGGTTWAGTGRVEVAAQSPLTGLWGESSMGGYLGTQLKRAGYDAIALRGASPEPMILVIEDDNARLESAEEVWGQDTYATERMLKERYPKAEVMSIGPAGENLVSMASLVHHQGDNVAARCGLGAVAGSKKLKAVVVQGTQSVPIADKKGFNALKKEALHLFKESDFLGIIQGGGGTASATSISIEMRDMPARNWDMETWEWKDEAEHLTGEAMHEQWPPKKGTCYACPIACKWEIEAEQLEGETGRLVGPEYESIAGLGSQVLNDDPLSVIQAADLCTRLGIDTISVGSTIAWAIEAFERGILSTAHTDGLQLEWGNPGLIIDLAQRMAENRPGIGRLLAQGTKKAATEIGGGHEFTIQVKGLELPFHHPRAMRGLEIAYATLPRGATHNEEGVVMDFEEITYQQWVKQIIANMDLSGANSSMVYCQFLAGALNADYTARLLTAVTGETYTSQDLYRAGERTWYLRRAFNLRLEVGLEADELPQRIIKQIQAQKVRLSDFEQALDEFHRQRELDERGVPSAQKLMSLDLDKPITLFDAQ